MGLILPLLSVESSSGGKKIERSADALRVSHRPSLSLQWHSTAQDWLATVQLKPWNMAQQRYSEFGARRSVQYRQLFPITNHE
jgi:hypothetical protein